VGVLQINFRGSTGYGKAFWEAGFKQWGSRMQDDITDGVQWLIKEGIADPKRIGIYGASYGGYATLAGLTFTPDLYACGIDYVGVSNIYLPRGRGCTLSGRSPSLMGSLLSRRSPLLSYILSVRL
jgi:dipeptidyl aminopeptidase/acylaminoacyl peptidase